MKLNEQQHNFGNSLSDGWYIVNHRSNIYGTAAYAREDDGNKNKAKEESNAALADCDDNDIEEAGFDCFAIAGDEEEGAILGFENGEAVIYD